MTLAENCVAGYMNDKSLCSCGVLNKKAMQERCREYIKKYKYPHCG